MRTIIAGSRTILDYSLVERAILSAPFVTSITSVLCGMAAGVDILGFRWATTQKIPIHRYPAEWGKYGKQAGGIRNFEMASQANALILVWDGRSPGSASMLRWAKKMDPALMIHEVRVEPNGLVDQGRA